MAILFIVLVVFTVYITIYGIKSVTKAESEEYIEEEVQKVEKVRFSTKLKIFFNKYKDYKKYKKLYVGTGVVFSVSLFAFLISTTNGAYISSYVYSDLNATATTQQVVPAVEAKEAVYEEPKTYTTYRSGEYVIGMSPSEYSTGNETSFTTSQSGSYTAGVDFPAGTYDIVAVSGSGNVQGTDLNEIMGVESENTSYKTYVSVYDNHTFETGDKLTTRSVAVELVPQGDDTFEIPGGTYDLVAIEGGGNVQGSGLNEIMGTPEENTNGHYVPNYDNALLTTGQTLVVSDVALQLTNTAAPKLITPAVVAKPETTINVNYEMIYDQENDSYTCKQMSGEVNCETLPVYDELNTKIETQKGKISEPVTGVDASADTYYEIVNYDDLRNEYYCQAKKGTASYKKVPCSELKTDVSKNQINSYVSQSYDEI
jgi:hypothetical protein